MSRFLSWSCLGLIFFCTIGCGGAPANCKQVEHEEQVAKVGKAPAANAVDVKLIAYEGSVDIVVDDIDAIADQIQSLIQQTDSYLSASEVERKYGQHRAARYVIRVPVTKYESLRDKLSKLGTANRNTSKSEDVTEEFVDLEARVRILKKEEQALEQMLAKPGNDVSDLIKVREQLSHNRELIEKAEGRMKLLSSRTTYSTITFNVRELKDYLPPTAPTFSNSMVKRFTNRSMESSRSGNS